MYSHIQTGPQGAFVRFIQAGETIEWDANNYCSAFALEKDGKAEQFNVHPFYTAGAPAHDAVTQTVKEVAPVLIDGKWTQQWEVIDLDAETASANQAAKEIADSKALDAKYNALWSSADKYVAGYISGVAIGLLTVGVLQAKPKAQAITAWSSSVWSEYYVRKALITLTSDDDLDFSALGPMPHSVPELQAEVGL